MIHFTDMETEDSEDSLAKLREFIDYLLEKFQSNSTHNTNLAIDVYLSLWKGCLSSKIYIPTKRERYGVKIYMLCESATGYIFNFIIYTGATTEYVNRIPSIKDFDNLKSPSKIVLSLLYQYVNGYCVPLDNYYTSSELAKELVQLQTDCYGTLKKRKVCQKIFGAGIQRKVNFKKKMKTKL